MKELLNQTDMPSIEEAELEGSWEALSISLAEVTEVVENLQCGKTPEVDEIHLEMMRALDTVELSQSAFTPNPLGLFKTNLGGFVLVQQLLTDPRPRPLEKKGLDPPPWGVWVSLSLILHCLMVDM